MDEDIKEEGKVTSIRVREETIKLLRAFQKHPRETNEEIIIRLCKYAKLHENRKEVDK